MVSEFDRRELLFERGFKAGKKEGAKHSREECKKELEKVLSYCNKETRRIESVGVDFVRIDDLTKYVEKRLKSLEERGV
jgi:hypothetical protein